MKKLRELIPARYYPPLAILLILGLVLSVPLWYSKTNPNLKAFQSLTPDEQQILKIKKSDPQGKLSHYDLIQRTAVPANRLEIWQCQVRPVVIKLKIGQSLTYVNYDKVPHMIQSDLAHNYAVPAQGERTIKVGFGHGAGIYSIVCDTHTDLSGLYFVTE